MIRNPIIAAIAAASLASTVFAAEPRILPGGTQAEDVRPGAGIAAQPGQTVTVHYTGWLYTEGRRGKKFDSSRGGAPFTFHLGTGEVISGWDEGVVGMRVGGVRTLILPPEAGYGAEGDETIPANSWLLFEIELIDVR